MDNNRERLVGVKGIADYLKTSPRNVYRWEKYHNLPLHRISDAKGYSVYAYKEDIDLWLKNRDAPAAYQRQSRKIRPRFIIITAAGVIFIVGGFFLAKKTIFSDSNPAIVYSAADNPESFLFDGKFVHIKDKNGKTLWAFISSDKEEDPKSFERYPKVDFLDIDNDGLNEVAARTYNKTDDTFYLTLFDNDRRILWERSISSDLNFNGLVLNSNFCIGHLLFARKKDSSVYIITYWRHGIRFLSLITSHDCQGNLINKYANVGHLSSLKIEDLSGDGDDEILFSGTNNLLNGEGIIGVLKLTGFKGISPPNRVEPEYQYDARRLQKYVVENAEIGNQLLYLRFKRTEHMKLHQHQHIFTHLYPYRGESIHLLLHPWDYSLTHQEFGFTFVFNRQFKLLYVIPNPSLTGLYPSLVKT
ncbi:MAG TPA: hypothetical protein ENN61_05390, partial [Bacteroidaceae bacterium]|nr:hypothetical protein [Bacteroidaceae bacterium]